VARPADGWTGKKKESGKEASKGAAGGRYNVLTPDMISQVLETIEREKLPFGSVILDASWFVTQRQWEADPERFPDIEEQHRTDP
jgi:alpha-glucosidase (family GH31 glycosyl hydrolase)